MKKRLPPFLSLPLGYLGVLGGWVLYHLRRANPEATLQTNANRRPMGITWECEEPFAHGVLRRVVENGIEHVTCQPAEQRFATPIFFQHGMWHGAWCWEAWQKQLAAWGWESHAISLPGHGHSPAQRSIQFCTLDYYLNFLRAEIARLPHKPVLVGHSMGGALTQWYLRYVGDDLPAVVMVASWVSHAMLADNLLRYLRLDPVGLLLMLIHWDAAPMVRTPQVAARALISRQALLSPEALYARLTPESALVLLQHNPPFWRPPERIRTPMLWLAGEADAFFSVEAMRRSAAHYGADFYVAAGAGHNIMMEPSGAEALQHIHHWLAERV
ncbi:MAG: alpha/beta fold hydrolase [Anaerolineae bacterium]|nr:MAG: alpha/beta fold hydrolase [Anaerolineae bacterium]